MTFGSVDLQCLQFEQVFWFVFCWALFNLSGGNKVSSRSHLVIRLHLHFTVNGEGRNAVLDVVDLAGSERIGSDVDEETSKDHIAIQAGHFPWFR